MWLSSLQQLTKVNVLEVPVASTRINVPETARDLGVVIDSQLSLSAQVAAVCRSGYYQFRQLRPLVRSMSDAGPGVHFLSPGPLQLTLLQNSRGSDEPAAVCQECGCTLGVGRSAA